MNTLYNKPTARESLTLVLSLATWMLVTALFVGIRPEHIGMGILIAALFLISSVTRKLVVALLPFAIFGISYDWMRIIPNYEVNPIDVQGLYEAEKSLFGITTATEGILTPNEYFHLHNCPAMDFMAGIFYLCWVPVPILFGLGLYFAKQRAIYLRFALVFLFVNLIGFAGYYIHPAAPPWYVMKYGFEVILNTPGDVAGLGRFDAMTGLYIRQPLCPKLKCVCSSSFTPLGLYGNSFLLLTEGSMQQLATRNLCFHYDWHLVYCRLFRTSLRYRCHTRCLMCHHRYRGFRIWIDENSYIFTLH